MREWYTAGTELRAYQGQGGTLTIPNTINGHNLTHINPYAFSPLKKGIKEEVKERRLEIRNITISEGYASIGDSAFEGCKQLEYISLPESMNYVGQRAFADTGIREVYIPSRFSGDREAFAECSALEKVVISNGVEYLYNDMFEWCENLKEVVLPNTLKRIDFALFAHCTKLKNIILPRTISSIEDYAFNDCGLESITIPENVKKIGASAFGQCKQLKCIIFEPGSELLSVGQWAFMGCDELEELALPEKVEKISDSLFSWCKSLKKVDIPKGVQTIYLNCFASAESLQRVIIQGEGTRILDRSQDWQSKDREQCLKGLRNATIVGHKDSPAEQFAKTEGYRFEELS